MARLRADYVFGATNAALTTGDTTLSSPALSRLPAVASPNVAAVTLHDSATGAYEIVHVTAHTAAAATATILRGQEGTSAQAWASGASWVHGPTAADLRRSSRVDDPAEWTPGLGYDEEFDATGTALPAGWSWVNQADATWAQEFGVGVLTHKGGSGDQIRAVVRALPTEGSWSAVVKLQGTTIDSNHGAFGMCLRESTSGKIRTFCTIKNGRTTSVDNWNSPTTWSANLSTPVLIVTPQYLRIRKNSATNWDFDASPDGVGWYPILTGSDVTTFLPSVDQIGLYTHRFGATWVVGAFHFFRVR